MLRPFGQPVKGQPCDREGGGGKRQEGRVWGVLIPEAQAPARARRHPRFIEEQRWLRRRFTDAITDWLKYCGKMKRAVMSIALFLFVQHRVTALTSKILHHIITIANLLHYNPLVGGKVGAGLVWYLPTGWGLPGPSVSSLYGYVNQEPVPLRGVSWTRKIKLCRLCAKTLGCISYKDVWRRI